MGRPRVSNVIRLQLIELLATGSTQKAAALKLDISQDSIARFNKEPDFIAAVEARTQEYLTESRAAIRMGLALCNSTLFTIIANSKNDQARIKAVELAYKLSGLLDVEPAVRSSGPIRWTFKPVGDTEDKQPKPEDI